MRAHFNTAKKVATTDGGLLLGAALLVLAAFSFAFFVDIGKADDGLTKEQKAHLEDCAVAHRELGSAVYDRRMDCRDVLPKPPVAKTAPR